MYLIWTAAGGQHFAHGDGARGRVAGYKARYVMKVGGLTDKGTIYLRMKGEEEKEITYPAAYMMDPTTGSLPNKHRVAPVADNTCVLVVSVYGTDLTYDDMVGAIEAGSAVPPQHFDLSDIEIEPTALKASTRASLGNNYGSANKGMKRPAISAAKKGKRHSEARKAAISAAKITCVCGECEKCKSRARTQKYRAKKAKKA